MFLYHPSQSPYYKPHQTEHETMSSISLTLSLGCPEQTLKQRYGCMMFTCEEVEKEKEQGKVNQICVNEQVTTLKGPLGEIVEHFRIVPLRGWWS